MRLLEVQNISAGYGSGDILKEVSIHIDQGEIVSLIGPNGAGKSTVMKSIFGLLNIRLGQVLFNEDEITNLDPDKIVHLGITYVPQTDNIFPTLTVHENLEMGAYLRRDSFRQQLKEVYELFPDLVGFRRKKAGDLSGGQRQMVAMARALMLQPRLILLDEPSAGLSPMLVEMIFEKIVDVNKTGVAILMVEQNAKQALKLSHRGYVLATGRTRFEGKGSDLLYDEEVARLYLGG